VFNEFSFQDFYVLGFIKSSFEDGSHDLLLRKDMTTKRPGTNKVKRLVWDVI
jgi:hypothetical protein